jgi:hypothetical protein
MSKDENIRSTKQPQVQHYGCVTSALLNQLAAMIQEIMDVWWIDRDEFGILEPPQMPTAVRINPPAQKLKTQA